MPMPELVDVFIACADADVPFVDAKLIPQLHANGISYRLPRDLPLGSFTAESLDAALDQTAARRVIALYSPQFLASRWAKFIEVLATTSDVLFDQRRLIPIKIAACDLPLRVAARVGLDFSDPERILSDTERLLKQLANRDAVTLQPTSLLGIKLFLSYARRDDEPFVAKLRDDLIARGFEVWWDRRSLPSRGVDFDKEIAAAIEQSHRLILIVGPAALESPYVAMEWQHALSRCIVVNPLLRLGTYPVPLEALSKLDTPDFRDDAQYAAKLDRFIEQLVEKPKPLGALTNIKAPEVWHIKRHAPLTAAIAAITGSGKDNTVAISAINGLGGVGKSVLAAAVAHDCAVRRDFPGGLAWIEVGKKPNLTELQSRIGRLVGLEASEFKENLDANKQLLSTAFHDKRMLIILDNVWGKNAVDAVNFGADGVKFLVTTRLVNLANDLPYRVRVDLLSDPEGADLIVRRAELKDDQRADCEAVSRQLNGLTLAVSIAAAKMKHDHLSPAAYLERLKRAENPFSELVLADPDDPFADTNNNEENLEASLALTYGELNAEMRRRFQRLGVFAPDSTFDAAAVAAVWDEPLETAQQKLNLLVNLELAARGEDGRYTQHGLLRAYARAALKQAGELEAAAARHANHYLTHMHAAEAAQTYYTMRNDLPQLRVAFGWAEQTQQSDLAQAVLGNTANLLEMLNLGEEYLDWANRLVGLAQAHGGDLGAALTSRGNAYQAAATVVTGEDRRARLLWALQDYTQALDLLRDVPLAYAQTLFNIAILHLEEEVRDDVQVIRNFWMASQLFFENQHAPYFEASQNTLRTVKGQLGARFDALWQEVVGQPQPAWLQGITAQLPDDEMDRLQDLLIGWVQTPDWDASRAYLEAHQSDLLTDQAEQALQLLIQGNPNARQLPQHLEILRGCRAQGIAAVYQQIQAGQNQPDQALVQALGEFLQAESDDAARALLAARPELLSDEAERVLGMFRVQGENADAEAHLARRRALWRAVKAG